MFVHVIHCNVHGCIHVPDFSKPSQFLQVRAFLQPPMEGVVVESYGAGNGPNARNDLLDAFADASKRGVLIVNITQCSRGVVAPSYATGKVHN